ncbi:hypothetical protein D915_002523 [Fasciola hepatica]|uniref:Uncharacterized protein n=1 Tax=Fasciola hepatica TaxID=6192 RepID=A0A4E0RJM3_FASHE|nr:hypothetical protein D915_002523 [Fasciola hepatica]
MMNKRLLHFGYLFFIRDYPDGINSKKCPTSFIEDKKLVDHQICASGSASAKETVFDKTRKCLNKIAPDPNNLHEPDVVCPVTASENFGKSCVDYNNKDLNEVRESHLECPATTSTSAHLCKASEYPNPHPSADNQTPCTSATAFDLHSGRCACKSSAESLSNMNEKCLGPRAGAISLLSEGSNCPVYYRNQHSNGDDHSKCIFTTSSEPPSKVNEECLGNRASAASHNPAIPLISTNCQHLYPVGDDPSICNLATADASYGCTSSLTLVKEEECKLNSANQIILSDKFELHQSKGLVCFDFLVFAQSFPPNNYKLK